MKLGAFIIPTGIGAEIGGYAGDASKYARKIAKKYKLIVNPNVVNAACFSGITSNMLYVEGYTLDEFFKGNLGLLPSVNNKIGVIFDKSIPQELLNIHLNTINAVKTVYGIDIHDFEITKEEVKVKFFVDKSGISTGQIENLETIKTAGTRLLNKGCNALAIVCLFPDSDDINYANGSGVDPVGGVEAIISHYISKELQVPCAHAPAFLDYSISTDLVHPKCAAEYITPTFLPCILLGLENAPQISTDKKGFTVDDVDFLIMPYNSLGCIPVLEMNNRNKKIYAIKENKTVININPFNFGIKSDIMDKYDNILEII